MNSMNPPFSLTVKSRLFYIQAIIYFIIAGIFILKLKDVPVVLFHFNANPPFNFDSPLIISIFYLLSLYFIYELIWMLIGETTFSINNGIMTITHKIIITYSTRKYDINEIKNVRIENNIPTGIMWGFQGFYFNITTSAISFDYNNNKIMLGSNLEKFDLKQLMEVIKK